MISINSYLVKQALLGGRFSAWTISLEALFRRGLPTPGLETCYHIGVPGPAPSEPPGEKWKSQFTQHLRDQHLSNSSIIIGETLIQRVQAPTVPSHFVHLNVYVDMISELEKDSSRNTLENFPASATVSHITVL